MGAILPYRELAPTAFLMKPGTPMADDESESDGVVQGGLGVTVAERLAMMQ